MLYTCPRGGFLPISIAGKCLSSWLESSLDYQYFLVIEAVPSPITGLDWSSRGTQPASMKKYLVTIAGFFPKKWTVYTSHWAGLESASTKQQYCWLGLNFTHLGENIPASELDKKFPWWVCIVHWGFFNQTNELLYVPVIKRVKPCFNENYYWSASW